MPDIRAPEGGVVGGDDEEVNAHQEVREREVLDVEGMNLIGLLHHESANQNDEVPHTGQDPHRPHTERRRWSWKQKTEAKDVMGYERARKRRDKKEEIRKEAGREVTRGRDKRKI